VSEATGTFRDNGKALWPLFDTDVERAWEFFISMPDVDGERIGVLGASCGGTQVLLLSTRHPEIRSAVFLSSSLPWIGEADIAGFEANRSVPLLAIAAEDDRGSADAARRLFASSTDPASRLVLYKGDAHGVPLFADDPHLAQLILGWFVKTL
jgi:dienelactone hydrolase